MKKKRHLPGHLGGKSRIGRPVKHGANALIYRDEIIKQFPELVRYTRDCYAGLVRDLAPEGADTLPTAKQIILDRLTAKLQTAGLLDIFMGKHGIIRRDRIDQRVLEAEPIVQTWLQVNNAIRADLQLLGLERRELGPRVLTADELVDAVEAERCRAKAEDVAAQDAPGSAPEGQAEAGESQGLADKARLKEGTDS